MDRPAVAVLFEHFWGASGWLRHRREPGVEGFEQAKAAGVMFDAVRVTHDEVVKKGIAAVGALTVREVADGFLASLSSRRLELRSALGSFAVLRFFPVHAYSGHGRRCAICGWYEDRDELHDLNVLSFERFKWGGVRHDQPLYGAFDLEQFKRSDRPRASEEDVRLLREVVGLIRGAPGETSAAALSKHLGKCGLKSNKQERDTVIGILGLCGILGTAAHPGYVRRFVPEHERELPPRRFVDMHYPACWWRASDGINEEALSLYFGHVL